jgi:low temperature requirement protein LtrA
MVRRVSSPRHFRQKTGEEQRATWLELFFDLVFVFAVTQLSHLLLHHLTLHGALQTLFLLLVVWWAWIYTTWMTNWFDPESVLVRLVLMVVMGSSLLMAVAIPEASAGWRRCLPALRPAAGAERLQRLRHTARQRLFRHLSPDPGLSLVSGVLWLAGGFAPSGATRCGSRRWRSTTWPRPWATGRRGWGARPPTGRSRRRTSRSGFPVVHIIALGESIVVAGATASSLVLGSRTERR